MIIVKFSGGLGNQIYQYALYRMLANHYPHTAVKADLSDYVLYDVHHGFELDHIFDLSSRGLVEEASFVEQIRVRGEMPMVIPGKLGKSIEPLAAWINCRMRNHRVKHGGLYVVEELPAVQRESIQTVEEKAQKNLRQLQNLDITKEWYIRGFWQQECFFLQQLEQLKKELCFPEYDSNEDLLLAEQIRNQESISIHLRRGDYIGSAYQILDQKYYREAIDEMQRYVAQSSYYIFSDDPEYAESFFAWLPEATFIQSHQGADSWREMQLMSECKHHILANSSFSTWAAYLSDYHAGYTIYPSRITTVEETGERSGARWIRITV